MLNVSHATFSSVLRDEPCMHAKVTSDTKIALLVATTENITRVELNKREAEAKRDF